MPVINFLELFAAPMVRQPTPLKKGDLVFHLSVERPCTGIRRWEVPKYCHAGLLAADYSDHWLGDRALVYHMGARRIDRDEWFDSVNGSRVDLVGIVQGLDRASRTELIDKALGYFSRIPKPLHRSCYWMGEATPDCHLRFPDGGEAYGFTCSSFVHQLISQQELESLIAFVGQKNTATQPFRRLFPGYLIGATKTDQIPFTPANWTAWQDHGQFIPAHARLP